MHWGYVYLLILYLYQPVIIIIGFNKAIKNQHKQNGIIKVETTKKRIIVYTIKMFNEY